MSSSESPGPPPLAASGLFTDILLNTYCAVTASIPVLLKIKSVFLLGIIDNVPADTLDCNPPPTKYLTVNVVLFGAIP